MPREVLNDVPDDAMPTRTSGVVRWLFYHPPAIVRTLYTKALAGLAALIGRLKTAWRAARADEDASRAFRREECAPVLSYAARVFTLASNIQGWCTDAAPDSRPAIVRWVSDIDTARQEAAPSTLLRDRLIEASLHALAAAEQELAAAALEMREENVSLHNASRSAERVRIACEVVILAVEAYVLDTTDARAAARGALTLVSRSG